MARVVVVLDGLFGLPVTLGTVGVLKASPAVVGGTVAIPGGDTS